MQKEFLFLSVKLNYFPQQIKLKAFLLGQCLNPTLKTIIDLIREINQNISRQGLIIKKVPW